jgi:predicted small metal-binding protein
MTYIVHCRDVGYDCDGVVRAETQEELLQQVATHAKSTHGLQEVTPEVVAKVQSVVREEKAK